MTRQIKVGKVNIGGKAPVVIQSMTKTDTRDVKATVRQIKALEKTGCEIVRVAVKDLDAARAISRIKKKVKVPIVADIHFDHRLAIACIESGADKIRLNPGNVRKREHILEVAKLAKNKKVPIRVGINSGSIIRDKGQGTRDKNKKLSLLMVKAALSFIKILESVGFYDIIVSLKASDVLTTIEAYREFSKRSKYPPHLGVTAAGPVNAGLVKSSVGMGILLSEGIGDTIRVSLTGDPCEEVIAAKNILQALELRKFGPEIISCPTCGRCQVDLQSIVDKLATRDKGQGTGKNLKIAVMGCEVNGPGEAKEADLGIAFGKNSGVLFKKGKIVKKIKSKDAVKVILAHM